MTFSHPVLASRLFQGIIETEYINGEKSICGF